MWVRHKSYRRLAMLMLGVLLGAPIILGVPSKANALTGINPQLSFQGKIVTAAGLNIPDGTYNMEFKIYQDGNSSGVGSSLKWTEDRLTSGGNGVTFTSGTFQVNLGAVAPFGTSVDWNQDTLWLSLQIGSTGSCTITTTFQANCGGDGEMTPFIRLTATPYALNADKLDGLDGTSFGQLTSNQTWTGTNKIQVASTTALQATNGTVSVLTVDTSNKQVLLGQTGASGANGQLVFNAATSSGFAITLNTSSSLASSYTLTLPAAAPSTNQCLQSGAVTAGQLTFGACATLQSAYSGGATINTTAGGTLALAASAAPTANILSISNAGQGVATNNANGLGINFVGGNAAVEAAGIRIDYAPGATSGGTWSGMRIVANTSGAATGVTSYGLKLEGPTSAGGGSDEGVYIGTGWDIGLDIQSGGIQLAAQSDPATPTAGNLRIYAKTIAGRVLPKWIGPAGVDTPFQANFGFNRIAMMSPSGLAAAAATTVMNSWGANFTNAGSTFTNPALATTNLLASVRRARLTSATTAGSLVTHTPGSLMAWRGNTAGLGGFFFTTRFDFATLQSGNRAFIGLVDNTTAQTNVDPTTDSGKGRLGVAINANTGNLKWVNNVSGTAPTVTDLGASFPVNTTSLYELIIYSPPNGSTITYRVQNLSTATATTDTSVSANVPANTTFLAPTFWMSNNATAAAVAMECAGWYLESDN